MPVSFRVIQNHLSSELSPPSFQVMPVPSSVTDVTPLVGVLVGVVEVGGTGGFSMGLSSSNSHSQLVSDALMTAARAAMLVSFRNFFIVCLFIVFLFDDCFLAVVDVDALTLRGAVESAALQVVPAVAGGAHLLGDAVADGDDVRCAVAVVDDAAGHAARAVGIGRSHEVGTEGVQRPWFGSIAQLVVGAQVDDLVDVLLGDAEGCECALEATCAEVLAVLVALDDYVLKLGCHDVRG